MRRSKKADDMKEIIPELKGFDCVDLDPIDEWAPESEKVYYYLTLHIGEPESEAADLYGVMVCNPAGIAAAKQAGVKFGPEPPIMLAEYSWQGVLNEVTLRLKSCRGFGWLDVQEKLRRQFAWEYEGYR